MELTQLRYFLKVAELQHITRAAEELYIAQHLKNNHKDYNTEKSLVKLVGKRRALLDYLIKKDINRYREIIKELGIRK